MILRRFNVWLIDLLVTTTPFLIMLPFIIILLANEQATDQLVGRSLIILGLFPCLLFYLILNTVQMLRNKNTLGRKLLRVQVVDSHSQQPLKFFQAIGYNLLWLVVLSGLFFINLLPLMVIPYAIALLRSDQRNLFQVITGIQVIKQDSQLLKETSKDNKLKNNFLKLRKSSQKAL